MSIHVNTVIIISKNKIKIAEDTRRNIEKLGDTLKKQSEDTRRNIEELCDTLKK